MSETKKILIMANNDVGLYQFRRMLIEKLVQLGKDVYISNPDGPNINHFKRMGCRFIETDVDRRGMNPKTDWKLFRRYQRLLKEIKPDLVITYTIKPNIYGGLACRLRRIPYTVNITGLGTAFQQDNLLRRIIVRMYRTAVKKAKVIFFENMENQKVFLDFRIAGKEQCMLLSGAGVDLDYYEFQWYVRKDKIHFLFIGRIMKEKGIDELFEVMHRLHEEGESCVLDVLGLPEEDYTEVIRKYEQEGWLNFYGYQQDVRPFIRKAQCFVLPSWHEGMANTNLECAAIGRAVITSNIPGCREAVLENQSGYLCEPKNAESLYEAMKKFLNLSDEERANMGLEGRRHMTKVFDKRKVVEKTIKGLGL